MDDLSHGVASSPRSGRQAGAGQTMVEFALTLSIFLLFVLGIVDLSRAVYARSVIANAAREGARYAVAHPPETEEDFERVKDVAEALIVALDRDLVVIEVNRPDGDHVEVIVNYTFRPVTLWVESLVDSGPGVGFPMRGRSVMATSPEG